MAEAMENHETSTLYLRNRLCSAVHFLLECFGPMHHMRMTKCISFVLKDIGTYLNQMDLTSQEEEYFQIPLTTMDELGILKKMDPAAPDTSKNNELGTNHKFEFVSRETSTDGASNRKYRELQTYEKLLVLDKQMCSGLDIVEDNEIRTNNVLGTLQKEANNVAPVQETSAEGELINEFRSDVANAELLRIFFVYYLSTNGNTHYQVIFKDLDNMAPRDVSKNLSSASGPDKLAYFKIEKEYFRMDSCGNLELQAFFYSPFEDLPGDSGTSEVNTNRVHQSIDIDRYHRSIDTHVDNVDTKISSEKKLLDSSVANFLNKRGKVFQKGIPMENSYIFQAIKLLKKSINITNVSYYEMFLTHYGSIYSSELYMCTPICIPNDSGIKSESEQSIINYIVSKQNTFNDYYIEGGGEKSKLKCCWLIGEYQDEFYYIDSSDNGKGHIYRMDLDGRSNLFAEDFLDFLNKLFKVYQEYESED